MKHRASAQITALAVFVKTPGLSPVKTRLAASIGETRARELYGLSVAAVISVVQQWCEHRGHLGYFAVAETAGLAEPALLALPAIGQSSGDLGTRIAHVERRLFECCQQILLIGADCPQIDGRLLDQAVAALAADGTVLGRAHDGGFWLYGSTRPLAVARWTSVPWSSSTTADALVAQIVASGQHPAAADALPTLTDLDNLADIVHVAAELRRLEAPTAQQRRLHAALLATAQCSLVTESL